MAGQWEVEIRSFPAGRGICIIAAQIKCAATTCKMETLPSHFDGQRFRNLCRDATFWCVAALVAFAPARPVAARRTIARARSAAAEQLGTAAHHLCESFHVSAASWMGSTSSPTPSGRSAPARSRGQVRGVFARRAFGFGRSAADRFGAAQPRSLRSHGHSHATASARRHRPTIYAGLKNVACWLIMA